MAKKKNNKSGQNPHSNTLYDLLNENRVSIILLILALFVLSFLYKPIVFGTLEVGGSDRISLIGTINQIQSFEEQTGERALWNPYAFGGMPRYHRYGTAVGSLDTLFRSIGSLLDWRVAFLWLGVVGIFLLVKWLGFANIVGIISGFAFALMPHFQGLIVVGHDSKLRAIMWIPFVLLTFLMFIKRRNISTALLFGLLFTLQFRTQHYQIIFYTLLLLLFTGIGTYVRLIIDKKWGEFAKGNLLLLGAISLFLIMVAHPFLSIREYTPHSTRGGNAVNLDQQVNTRSSGGVSFEYATNWSFSIPEIYDLIVPKFHGGTSQETYTGDAVPAFQNRQIPSYWGDKPFTQSYEYIGILLVIFALVGVVFRWDHSLVKSLSFLTIFSLLLALGNNFEPFYELFFYNLPYFDKFRAPVMILTLVMFNVAVLAAIGMDYLIRICSYEKKDIQKLAIIAGSIAVLLILPLLLGQNFALTKSGETQQYIQQYGQGQGTQVVEMLRMARLDILRASITRSLILFLLVTGTIIFLWKSIISKGIFALLLLCLIGVDVGLISNNFLQGKFINEERLERQTYSENALDEILQQDDSLFRVAPLMNNMASNTRWNYYYQSIGGYSAAKLQVIQDIIDNNLFVSLNNQFPFNLNVLRMLDAQYLITSRRFETENIRPIKQDDQQGIWLLENERIPGRAFFVDSVIVLKDGPSRLRFMNTQNFDPARMALLEEPLETTISMPDEQSISITKYTPNELEIDYRADTQTLLVLSEIYYPHGWQAKLDNGKDLKIYKTNHLMRSMVVPAGEHSIRMIFHPGSYYLGTTISRIGFILSYIGILLFLYRDKRDVIKRGLQNFRNRNA